MMHHAVQFCVGRKKIGITHRNPSSRVDCRLHSLASSIAAGMAPQYVSVSKGEGGVAVLTLTRCVLAR